MGLSKPVIFGFIIASIGCYYGLSAKGGTQGVGRATTQAVVAASVLILVSDFFHHPAADGDLPVLTMSSLAPQSSSPSRDPAPGRTRHSLRRC